LLFIYNYLKNSRNYFGVIVGTLFVVFFINSYMNYTESEGVESRIVTSSDGSSEEGTGREAIWETAILYIKQGNPTTGFGNYTTFTRDATYPHNIFLEVYIEMGMLSLLLLIGIFILIIYEIFKVFFIYKSNTKLELFLIFATVYYLGLAQFSVDLPRNLTFLYTFILYIYLKHFNHVDEEILVIEEPIQKSIPTKTGLK
jgi:O-antigen ligase